MHYGTCTDEMLRTTCTPKEVAAPKTQVEASFFILNVQSRYLSTSVTTKSDFPDVLGRILIYLFFAVIGAQINWDSLTVPGLLVGILGYATANLIGITLTQLCRGHTQLVPDPEA